MAKMGLQRTYDITIHIHLKQDRVVVKREAPNGTFEIKKYRTAKSRHSSAILQIKNYEDELCDGIHLHLGSSKLGAALQGRPAPDKYKRQAKKLQEVIDNADRPITVVTDKVLIRGPSFYSETKAAISTQKNISL